MMCLMNKHTIEQTVIKLYNDKDQSTYEIAKQLDTYPNKSRMKYLYLYNIKKKNKLLKIGEFFESLDYCNETRCDLHPRFSIDGKSFFIDSVHNNKRALYMIFNKIYK